MNELSEIKDLRKYYIVTFLIYISVFINSYVFFKEPFEFYLGYVILLAMLPVIF